MKKADRDKFEQTYGIFKFKLSTPEEQKSAMDLTGENILFKKLISYEYERFYDNLQPPELGDWLIYNKEYGQTYQEFIRSSVIPVSEDREVIYLAPIIYGDDELNQGFINALVIMCQSYFFGMKVKLLPQKINLREVGAKRHNGRVQANVSDVLKLLTNELPADGYCLVGFTEKDLINSASKRKTGSFTSGNISSRVSVFTFASYDPLYYLNPGKDQREQEKLMKYYFILLKRICKVAVNEVLHLFGLKNCIYFQCIMNGYNTMEEFDKRPLEMCPVCLRKLYTVICQKGISSFRNIRVNNVLPLYERFIKMYECLNEYFAGLFDYEIEWYNAKVESLSEEL
jgi:archaemetzincin